MSATIIRTTSPPGTAATLSALELAHLGEACDGGDMEACAAAAQMALVAQADAVAYQERNNSR
jgi:hypothetical protein